MAQSEKRFRTLRAWGKKITTTGHVESEMWIDAAQFRFGG
jgi:hypothetical protein